MSNISIAVLSKADTNDQVINQFTDEAATHLKAGIIQTLSAVKNPAKFKLDAASVKLEGDDHAGTAGNVIKAMIEKMPKVKQQQIMTKVSQPSILTPALKADFIKNHINLASEKHVLNQPDAMSRFNYVSNDMLKSLTSRVDQLLSQTTFNNGAVAASGINKNLLFKVHQVKCIDETGGWWAEKFGDDEIDMGGAAIDDKARETLIPAFRVDSSFDDGETKTYSPPRILKTFVLDATYPKVFSVFVGLSEIDGGGFVSFLDKLYAAVKTETTTILAKIAARLGGTVIGIFGGKLAEIITTLATKILDKLISWLKGLFADDVFEPRMAVIKLRDANTGFGGSALNSPVLTLDFSGHDGYYRVFYSWELKR